MKPIDPAKVPPELQAMRFNWIRLEERHEGRQTDKSPLSTYSITRPRATTRNLVRLRRRGGAIQPRRLSRDRVEFGADAAGFVGIDLDGCREPTDWRRLPSGRKRSFSAWTLTQKSRRLNQA